MRNTGRFDDTRELVVVRGVRRLAPGDVPPSHMSRSRLRDWWRRGWIAYAEDYDPEAGGGSEGGGTDQPDPISDEPTPMHYEAGAKGWFTVTFSDGSTKKVRWAALIEMGLVEDPDAGSDDDDPVVDPDAGSDDDDLVVDLDMDLDDDDLVVDLSGDDGDPSTDPA